MATTKERRSWVSDEALAAAEAVCCDDDDLVSILIDAGIAHAVTHLLDADLPYSAERESRCHRLLGELRAVCAQDREEFANRMRSYIEAESVPF